MSGSLPAPLSPVGSRIQRRHPEYYLNTGDIIFRVEDTLFRVHKYFFLRESEHFQHILPYPPLPGQRIQGTTEDSPIFLDNTYSDDFCRFLWVFYNPEYTFEGVIVDEWRSILRLAHQWGFAKIHALAIRELEKLRIGPIKKILIYHEYAGPEDLLVPSYTELTLRDHPLSIEEGKALGIEVSLMIAEAREAARGKSDSSGLRSPGPITLDEPELQNLVKGVFHVAGDTSDSTLSTQAKSSASHSVPLLNEVVRINERSTNGDSKPGPDAQNGSDQKMSNLKNGGTNKPPKKGLDPSLWPM